MENVCASCQYYENCHKPKRFRKCMGYKERTENTSEVRDTKVGEENAR